MDSNMQEEGERKYDIVSFSRIDKNKNIGLLLRAVSRIKNECSVKLIVAGDGEELDNLKRMAKELAIGEYIDFVGYISDLEDKLRIYRNSRIFVSCLISSGFNARRITSLLDRRNAQYRHSLEQRLEMYRGAKRTIRFP